MMLSDALLEQIIEGALLASGQTLSVDRIQELFDEGLEPEKERILSVLERIGEKCESNGYELKKVATGYRFQVKQDIVKWVSRLWEEKPQRYSRALLETLSIIAYRQPCTRGEIEDVRGVAVSSHITKTLVEREWIQVVGHRDVPGRPAMFATTKMFLDYFNLESLDQLPTLEEIQEIADANHALELEDKKEEGDFDLSITLAEMGDSENLISAAADLEAADALVQQVEDNLQAKADEELQAEQGAADMLTAEQAIADGDEAVFGLSDALRNSLSGIPSGNSSADSDSSRSETDEDTEVEMTEEQLAEATIARMIAEQESLLQKAGKGAGTFKTAAPVPKAAASGFDTLSTEFSSAQSDEQHESATLISTELSESNNEDSNSEKPNNEELSTLNSDDLSPDTPSVFGGHNQSIADTASEEDEDALAAAMEEEMMAQLEAEQEALLEEQNKE